MRRKFKIIIIPMLISLFLSCWHSYFEKQVVTYDLTSKKIEIKYENIYSLPDGDSLTVTDSIKKIGWKELCDLKDTMNSKVDTIIPHYYVKHNIRFELQNEKVNVFWTFIFYCDTISDTADWFTWDFLSNKLLVNVNLGIYRNNDEIIMPLTPFHFDYDPKNDTLTEILAKTPILKTGRNILTYFPDTMKYLQYIFDLHKSGQNDYFVKMMKKNQKIKEMPRAKR
jgi:hypothetical protein